MTICWKLVKPILLLGDNKLDTTIDYQQVREVAYIAGLMDGEGSFCMERNEFKRHVRYTPRISFGITNQALANRFQYFLEANGITYYQSKRIYPEPYLPVYSFEIKRMLQVKKFLQLLLNDLTGKRRQAELLLKFIESRLDENGDIKYRTKRGVGLNTYAPWVHSLWIEMRTLNGKGRPKGTAPNRISEQLANLHDQMSTCTIKYGTKAMVSSHDENVRPKG